MWRARGFSLIELVIVLGITSVLLTLALPRFVLYRSRAAQAEVKSNLGSLMRSQHAHLAEYGGFTDNLTRVAWEPDGTPRYIYGCTSDGVPAASGLNDTAELAASGYGTFRSTRMTDAFGNPLAQGDLPAAVATSLSITLGAAGKIDEDDTLDQWTFDTAGNLVHVSDDLAN
ncbi:MAG: type II secretion system protein [Deltaproteobacteria bacterium]|nr:type II secretion system protein [Deltaproteobacteria bacterium]